jgi:hypothetical protein
MTHPSWWLVRGLEWPEDARDGDMAECVIACAPDLARRMHPTHMAAGLSPGLETILAAGEEFAAEHPARVVFFSDLTRRLNVQTGKSWANVGVDWESALAELFDRTSAMYMTLSYLAYVFICDASLQMTLHYPGRVEVATEADRERVRESVLVRLAADWPPYIRGQIDSGHLPRI